MSLSFNLSFIKAGVFFFKLTLVIYLPTYRGASLQTDTLMGLLTEFFIFVILGSKRGKLLIAATSLATPRILKQSPRFGVRSSLIIASLPVNFD